METKELEEEIQKLKEALNQCPDNEFFVETKQKLKAQLRIEEDGSRHYKKKLCFKEEKAPVLFCGRTGCVVHEVGICIGSVS